MEYVNLNLVFRDVNNTGLNSKKVLFTPLKSPETTSSFLSVADSYQFVTDATGSITGSVVAGNYRVTIAKPEPESNFYVNVSDTGSVLYSGLTKTGSAQIVYFDLINLVKDPFSVKSITLSPETNYPYNFDSNIIVLGATSSKTDATGSVWFNSLVPGIVQVDCIGKVTTTFYISVPSYEYTGSEGAAWNAKDLLVVKPSKGISVKLTNADSSYVLTVSSSDARYIAKGGGIDSASYALYADLAKTASYALNGGGTGGGTSLTTGSTYPITSSHAVSSLDVPFNGNRAIKRDDPDFEGETVGGSTVKEFLENFFFPFVSATVSLNSGTTYYQTGSSNNITLLATVTSNDETSFGSGSIKRDGVEIYTDATPTPTFGTTDTAITVDKTYYAYVQADNNGSPTVAGSSAKNIRFVYPILYGTSSVAGLNGTNLYNAMLKSNVAQASSVAKSFIGTGVYIYYAIPTAYNALTSILDPNSFEVINSFDYSSSVSVTSDGLTHDWTHNYKVYRLTNLASPNGTFTFKY